MIEVVDYRPDWPSRFEQLRAAYAETLDAARVPYRSIEHIGSTSVVGLAAKPVIDIDVVVDEAGVDDATSALASIGFVPRGDLGIAARYAFAAPDRFAPTNTYVVVEGSLSLRNHLAVRDTLRTDATLRHEYERVKRQAADVAVDIDEYVELKSDVLGRILERAGISPMDRATIHGVNRVVTSRPRANTD